MQAPAVLWPPFPCCTRCASPSACVALRCRRRRVVFAASGRPYRRKFATRPNCAFDSGSQRPGTPRVPVFLVRFQRGRSRCVFRHAFAAAIRSGRGAGSVCRPVPVSRIRAGLASVFVSGPFLGRLCLCCTRCASPSASVEARCDRRRFVVAALGRQDRPEFGTRRIGPFDSGSQWPGAAGVPVFPVPFQRGGDRRVFSHGFAASIASGRGAASVCRRRRPRGPCPRFRSCVRRGRSWPVASPPFMRCLPFYARPRPLPPVLRRLRGARSQRRPKRATLPNSALHVPAPGVTDTACWPAPRTVALLYGTYCALAVGARCFDALSCRWRESPKVWRKVRTSVFLCVPGRFVWCCRCRYRRRPLVLCGSNGAVWCDLVKTEALLGHEVGSWTVWVRLPLSFSLYLVFGHCCVVGR